MTTVQNRIKARLLAYASDCYARGWSRAGQAMVYVSGDTRKGTSRRWVDEVSWAQEHADSYFDVGDYHFAWAYAILHVVAQEEMVRSTRAQADIAALTNVGRLILALAAERDLYRLKAEYFAQRLHSADLALELSAAIEERADEAIIERARAALEASYLAEEQAEAAYVAAGGVVLWLQTNETRTRLIRRPRRSASPRSGKLR